MNLKETADYQTLAEEIHEGRTAVCYFATPPAIFGAICQGLESAGLINPNMRVVLEKPIGHDLASSAIINDQVAAYFAESQISN